MKYCDVPADFELDLGYRKIAIKAGARHYPDEIADAYPMSDYVATDPDAPAVQPADPPPADPPPTDPPPAS